MIWNFKKLIVFLICLFVWAMIVFFMVGCASVDKIHEKEGWFPNIPEDAQDRTPRYNMMDSPDGSRGNSDIKVFRLEY